MEHLSESQRLLVDLAITLFIGTILVVFLQRGVVELGRRLHFAPLAMKPLQVLIRWVGILIVLAVCLDRFHISLGAYIASILGLVAIGFVAVWSILSNISCTVLLILLKPFQIDDQIEFAGEPVSGRVVDLNFVYTTLLNDEGQSVLIPNNLFFQRVIKKRAGRGGLSLADQLYVDKAAASPPTL